MRLQDRQRLINSGLANIGALHPASLIFPGFPPVPGSRRQSIATPQMRLGGYLDSAPCVFLVALADIPAGLVFSAKTTVFTYEGIKYRVDGVDPEAGTHTRLTTNLASR